MESREKYKNSVDKAKINENQNEFFRACSINFPNSRYGYALVTATITSHAISVLTVAFQGGFLHFVFR